MYVPVFSNKPDIFSYVTTTNVKYDSEIQLELPGITICYHIFTQLKSQFKEQFIKDNKTMEEISSILGKMPIKVLSSNLEKYPNKLKSCKFKSKNGSDIDCLSLQNIS